MKMDRKLAISLQIKKFALGPFLGTYRSLVRGQGIEYDEIRKYVPGDDPKSIVWAKLAQTGESYVKTYLEERDLTVIIALDISSSVFWKRRKKASLALEVASVLLFSAAVSRDRVGLACFSDTLERFIPPRRGMAHAGKLTEILFHLPEMKRKTSLKTSFQAIGSLCGPKRAALFVISDFMCKGEEWEASFGALSKNNDVIAMKVQDSWERNPFPMGWIYTEDAEESARQLVHWNGDVVEEWKRQVEEERQKVRAVSTKHNIGYVELDEGKDPLQVLRTYFEHRCSILKRR